jgi:dephospho-CoA kinase
MSSKVLVGLIGAPGAGKDVLAEFLVKSKSFKHFAFADKVKKGYYAISGFSEEQFKTSRGTELEQTIRKGLWEFSDQMRRKYGDLYFITPVIQEMVACQQSVVVSDVRTADELEQMEALGATVVHVFRDPTIEFNCEYVPGTRIGLDSGHWGRWLLFWNHFDSLESLQNVLPDFFESVLKV